MPYAAITYRVKPGHEEEIAAIFDGFTRVDTPVFHDDGGVMRAHCFGTAVSIKDDIMVRVIHYEGDFSALGRHIGSQHRVHLIEAELAPYLVEARETSTQEGFGEYFRNATMRCVSQLSVKTDTGGSDST